MTLTFNNFIILLSKLNTVQLLGICRILNIPIVENDEARDGEIIVSDIMNKFNTLNRIQKRNLIKIVKAAQQ